MGKMIATSTTGRADPRYWLYEKPVVYETGKNAIRYYERAGKIQIATCDYVVATKVYDYDYEREEVREEKRPGKLSSLDLAALAEDPETLHWLIGILQGL